MDFEREMTEEEIYEAIDNALMRFEDRDNLSLTDELILRNEAYNSLRKYDVIQEYLDDEEVMEHSLPCLPSSTSPIERKTKVKNR